MPKKKTHEEFVEEVKNLSEDGYEFLSKYEKSSKHVKTKHKKCGYIWEIIPNSILMGLRKGYDVCPQCNNKLSYTTETFNTRVFELVGKEYEVLEDYVHSEQKIKMKHVKCGHIYSVKPNNFIQGNRCPECYKKIRLDKFQKTHDTFVKEVNELVGTEYSVLGKYIGCTTNIEIKHNLCETIYSPTPSSFLRGQRCPNCFGTKKRTTESFKQEIYDLVGNEYVVLGEYENTDTKIELLHKDCHQIYSVTPYSFIRKGNRCTNCSGLKKKTTEIFRQEVYQLEQDDYTVLGEYVNTNSHILIKHNICGNEYKSTPSNFLRGHRCKKCCGSKGEESILNWLDSKLIEYKPQFILEGCRYRQPLRFDFAVFNKDQLVSLLEYDGRQHFEVVEYWGGEEALRLTQLRDNIKNEYCNDNNIPLLRIPYWEENNIESILYEHLSTLNLI